MTWPALDADFLAANTATYGFRLGIPKVVGFAPDGDVLFLRTPPRSFVGDLYQLDAATGQVTQLATADTLLAGADEHLSDADKARRERTRTATKGIVDVRVSDNGATIMIPLGDRLFLIDRASGALSTVGVDGYPYDPHLSPSGERFAYVVDGDLFVQTLGAHQTPLRIARHEQPTVEYGVAEFVAQEELGRTRGFWWSPDSQQLVYQRTDNAPVDQLYVANPLHPEQAPVAFRYPRAGRPNAEVTLHVHAIGHGSTELRWDRARYPYVADVQWPQHGPLTLVVMDRDQHEVALLAANPSDGSTTVLHSERDDAWFDILHGAPQWLADGSGFLWASERSGAWQLELHDAKGALVRTLTDAHFGLRGLAGIDSARGVAWVMASADPTETAVWTVPLAGGAPTRITQAPGVWTAQTSDDGTTAVLTGMLADGSVQVDAVRSDGSAIAAIPTTNEAPPYLPAPIYETISLGDHHHATAIIRPRSFDPTRRYPVLLHVYGGPTARMVWHNARAYLMDQWYADGGFVVVRIDGRGTPNQGRAWSRAVLKDLITVPLADQVDVLHALAVKHPELDLGRVGIYGWSFGGYLSAMATILRPDVFQCGIAGAPVTDWNLYDSAYTERYMKQPADNADGYRTTSAIENAGKLVRPLLIIHGIADDNVHLANSLGLVQALFVAGKRAEFVPLATTHMVPDPAIALAQERLQVEFFQQHLAAK
ncbi:MAG: S9 family peptidase [Deltaproteobacteria bacterium]|nr:S9 family peptidase [Deltaproteobacteria bacterium]